MFSIRQKDPLSKNSEVDLNTGRLLLVIIPFLFVIGRGAAPSVNQPSVMDTLTLGLIAGYAALTLLLSFTMGRVRANLYYWVIILFYIGAPHLLFKLYDTNFHLAVRSAYTVFLLLTPWYFTSRRELLVYLTFLLVSLVPVYFFTPDPVPEASGFIYRFALFALLVYLIVGSRIRTLHKLLIHDLQYQDLTEKMNEGVLRLNLAGKVRVVNGTLCELTGYERQELLNNFSIERLIPQDDVPEVRKKLQTMRSGQSGQYECRIRRKNGETIWMKVSGTPELDREGNIVGTTCVMTDITDKKMVEATLQRFSEESRQAQKEIARKNAELERFAEMAASDLKFPLQKLEERLTALETLLPEAGNGNLETTLDAIRRDTRHMQELIDALTLYSASGVKQLQPEMVDLGDIIRQVEASMAVPIQANNVEIRYAELPTVFADRIQLLRLFRNLIDNAIKFRSEAQPVINITFSEQTEKQRYSFTVEDNGVGISPEHYEEIFMIFKRVDQQEQSGLGLGLAICKKIVSNHGGRMWLKSTVGQGTAFYFTLPASPEGFAETAAPESGYDEKALQHQES